MPQVYEYSGLKSSFSNYTPIPTVPKKGQSNFKVTLVHNSKDITGYQRLIRLIKVVALNVFTLGLANVSTKFRLTSKSAITGRSHIQVQCVNNKPEASVVKPVEPPPPSSQKKSRCDICPSPSTPSTPRSKHTYGDYLVLVPDEESSKRLAEISKWTSQIIKNEAGLFNRDIQPVKENQMHLTVAMPLKAMNPDEAGNLLNSLKSPHVGAIDYTIVFDNPQNGGCYNFGLSSPNFAPGIDLRLPTQVPQSQRIEEIARKAFQHIKDNHLESNERPLKEFKPHITIGKIKAKKASEKVHARAQHRENGQEPLKTILSSELAKNLSNKTLPLTFSRIEIQRVDIGEGKKYHYHLGSLDLKTNQVQVDRTQFADCAHTCNS